MNKAVQFTFQSLTLFCAVISMVCIPGCTKLIEAPIPSEYVADANVYNTNASAISVLDGIYISMNAADQPFQGYNSITLFAGLSADELSLYSGYIGGINSYNSYFTNNLSQALGALPSGAEHWSPLYSYIFRCNAAIEGLQTSTGLAPAIKQQLLGEAEFLRAFYYFYLVNLFGDVPLVLTTDPDKNKALSRSSASDVYLQILEDLQDAEGKLSVNFLNGQLLATTTDRIRPTQWAAKALLARVYLYTGDWAKSEAKATEVINNSSLFTIMPLNSVFLKNSKEAIWQLQPTDINFNTQDAKIFVIPQEGPGANYPVFLSKNLLTSFEPGDQRVVYGNWVDTTIYQLSASQFDTVAYVNKYKVNMLDSTITSGTGTTNMKEYFMVFRLGEQYLVRAEARAQQGNVSGAQADVNTIRSRAFLSPKPVTVSDKAGLLAAIWHERQVELFCEWGHRWLDLKRTGKVDEVMNIVTPIKSSGVTTWHTYQQLYPLPLSDLQLSKNLLQNNGY